MSILNRRIANWGLVIILAFGCCEGARAGDPILFFSAARVKSTPIKRVDRELERSLEAPSTPTPTDGTYSPADRQRREARRQMARRRAQVKRNQRNSEKDNKGGNWLLDEAGTDGNEAEEDSSLRALGGEKVDEEELQFLEPENSDLGLDLTDLASGRSAQTDSRVAMRAAASANAARRARSAALSQALAPGRARSLGEQMDLRTLLGSQTGTPVAPPDSGRGGSSFLPDGRSSLLSPVQLAPDLTGGSGAGRGSLLRGRNSGANPERSTTVELRDTRASDALSIRKRRLSESNASNQDRARTLEQMRRLGR